MLYIICRMEVVIEKQIYRCFYFDWPESVLSTKYFAQSLRKSLKEGVKKKKKNL